MGVKRVSPEEAKKLMDEEGWVYVDVRSIPEFEAGHPAGAFNVPLLHRGPMGMAPNPDFMAVMERNFPRDAKLVVGCHVGGRSLRAATLLAAAGYQSVVDQRAGFEGAMNPGGWVAEPGWRPKGLPVATVAEPGHSYDALKGRG